ncbi:MAG TPA: hypothetical protein DDW50_19820, partial [Firmicutes bacterium]|nr:hypothetical protein [Bacillota bacterium]
MDYHFQYPHGSPPNSSSPLTNDPVLYLVRDDMMDELGAIVGYMECADLTKDYRISAQFREIANDEMEHFIRLMGTLAQMDLSQANEFQKAGVTEMMMGHGGPISSGMGIPVQCPA